MNLYISPDLRKRMRKFDGKINWSQVASAAIEAAMTSYVARELKRRQRHSIAMSYRWVKVADAE
jgi:hypothetical protein